MINDVYTFDFKLSESERSLVFLRTLYIISFFVLILVLMDKKRKLDEPVFSVGFSEKLLLNWISMIEIKKID